MSEDGLGHCIPFLKGQLEGTTWSFPAGTSYKEAVKEIWKPVSLLSILKQAGAWNCQSWDRAKPATAGERAGPKLWTGEAENWPASHICSQEEAFSLQPGARPHRSSVQSRSGLIQSTFLPRGADKPGICQTLASQNRSCCVHCEQGQVT